jgi:inosine/xanthosine triphosphate pyrophosphatase family protein
MSADEKNAVSHRGEAFRALAPLIAELVVRPAG